MQDYRAERITSSEFGRQNREGKVCNFKTELSESKSALDNYIAIVSNQRAVLVCNTWLSDGFASQAIKII
jgi:hypothetical protein